MDERARRIGENEILFRKVNAKMRSLDELLRNVSGARYDFICECGEIDCNEQISLTLEEYERVHEDPTRFTIVPGHEKPGVEDVVERHDTYDVVRKHEGGPAELAAKNAPS